MTIQAAIESRHLTKSYQGMNRPALANLDLTVNQGEIFGYLGPNGAGKTTTIRMMLDLIRPTAGSIRILGMDAQRESVALHQRIGFLPGELRLWGNQTGLQVVHYLGRLRGTLDMRYVNELTSRLDLDLSKPIRSYSTGNRRKIGLVLALMHKPELLILDEPTGGLDPLMQQIFNDLAFEAKAEGRTVFLSSHILSEVQAICDRVAILREGQLQAVARVMDLVRVKFQWITLTFQRAVAASRLANVPGVSQITAERNTLSFRLSGDFDPVLRALSDEYIVHILSEEPSLEEIFLSFYSRDLENGRNGTKAATIAEGAR